MTRKVTASCSHKRLLGIALSSSSSFSWLLNHPHARPYTLTQRKKHAVCRPFSRVAPSHSLSIGNLKVYPLPKALSSPPKGIFFDQPIFLPLTRSGVRSLQPLGTAEAAQAERASCCCCTSARAASISSPRAGFQGRSASIQRLRSNASSRC